MVAVCAAHEEAGYHGAPEEVVAGEVEKLDGIFYFLDIFVVSEAFSNVLTGT